MATMFKVTGPFDVPAYRGLAARAITEDDGRSFWKKHSTLGSSRGCYVFGVRAGRGLTPGYVGRATKSFRQEVFAYHKLNKYNQFLIDYRKGTPVLFFVYPGEPKSGAPNVGHMGQLETFLIQTALAANPYLLNVRGTKAQEWGIAGVLRSGKGKTSAAAQSFRRLMKI